MEINRRKFFKSVGGAAAVALMTSEQKADALEHFMEEELEENMLDQGRQMGKYPTVAELASRTMTLRVVLAEELAVSSCPEVMQNSVPLRKCLRSRH